MIPGLAPRLHDNPVRLRCEVDARTPAVVLRDAGLKPGPLPPLWLGAHRRRRAAVEASLDHRLLLIETVFDGPQSIDVLVEEAIPKHLVERAWLEVDGLGLRVPTGTLVASGLDALGGGASLARAIPPGAYRVTVLAPDWSLDETPPAITGPSGVSQIVLATNAILATATLAAVALIVFGIAEAWSAAMVWAAGLLLVAWLSAVALQRPSRGERSRMRRAAMDARFPAIVLRLRRLAHVDELRNLGAGHVDFNQPVDRPLPSIHTPRVEPVG